ncbi:hypothetical protein Hanom_Chr02g00127221 [Helianthus anomalus]
MVVCKDKEYQVSIPSDLMRFAKEDITMLSKNHIRCDPNYEVSAKYYTCAVASIMSSEIWAGEPGQVETRIMRIYLVKDS